MNDYYEVDFRIEPPMPDACDLLADALGDAGFETFEPSDEGDAMKAFVPAPLFDEDAIRAAIASLPLEDVEVSYCFEFVEGRDWNAEWEKNYFRPIVIGSRVVVHSSFHTDVPAAEYDIVIDPKMAFGTGHHATTTLMALGILAQPMEGASVVDMGTGTGILAILAAMRGAAKVVAVEIDGFAYENTLENLELNGVAPRVEAVHGDASALGALAEGSQDVFLANINRNIVVADMPAYARTLKPGGVMLLSGFYVEDIPHIDAAAGACGLWRVSYEEMDRWACVRLEKRRIKHL
ncbi:MAG: 50S ribosomal protein L11 methyltransferase [Muribaculaceae bacterium]|nr:50S ribosomal protein L11 methyltransferase [Muribaculaceae bacterium]